MWLKYFHDAIAIGGDGSRKIKEDHFFTIILNFYLINYYSPAITQLGTFKITQYSE